MIDDVRLYEVETLVGIEAMASRELAEAPFGIPLKRQQVGKGNIRFRESRPPEFLLRLKLAQAVYRVLHFPVPRPKALLGHQHFRRISDQIAAAIQLDRDAKFVTLGIDAAGSDSAIMQRLRLELAQAGGLQATTSERGDLLLRILPARDQEGWECLVRLTPRPLATREWRIRNFPGALNATAAQAMVRLSVPSAGDVFVNLCCGSGSLLIERAQNLPQAGALIGLDNDLDTISLGLDNISAANAHVMVIAGDCRMLPLPAASATALVADLPFGQRSGSHQQNLKLYPEILVEAGRIAREGARLVVLTHEVRLMDSLISISDVWSLRESFAITLRGIHPRIYVLIRNA